MGLCLWSVRAIMNSSVTNLIFSIAAKIFVFTNFPVLVLVLYKM